VEVPGGGSFNESNTMRNCSSASGPSSCEPLKPGEWIALAGGFVFDVTTRTATFHSGTRIKKSTINSSLQPPGNVVEVQKGQVLRLSGEASEPFKVDKYAYVLLRCVQERCWRVLLRGGLL
jgi:hypothetical protein